MRDNQDQDQIYAETHPQITDFVFDKRVAAVFPDMIQRSVPGYSTIINVIGAFAANRVTAGSRCYDLGCSLGAAALAIRQGVGDCPCQIVAVDNSLAMLQRAKAFIAEDGAAAPVTFVCADIQDIRIERASLVVLNFTLQFIPIEHRLALLQSVYTGMESGGMLILSEKIALQTATTQTLFIDMHHAFKKSQGYSELEISQKRSALEKVLLPETLKEHTSRLRQVGFNIVEPWFQCFNFVSLLAIK